MRRPLGCTLTCSQGQVLGEVCRFSFGVSQPLRRVLGAYGRDELNDNGERLLLHAAENRLALLNTSFATPKRGVSYRSQPANSGKGQFRLEYVS